MNTEMILKLAESVDDECGQENGPGSEWLTMFAEKLSENRKVVLLRATYDLLKKCEESPYVLNAIETTVFYDDAECDGMCLANEIANELGLEEIG
jgi:hypothetical protein